MDFGSRLFFGVSRHPFLFVVMPLFFCWYGGAMGGYEGFCVFIGVGLL